MLQVESVQGSTAHFLMSVGGVESNKKDLKDRIRHEMKQEEHKVGLVLCSYESTG